MSVQLSPVSPRAVYVGSADDPYKKYWWAILLGFVLTGAWLCMPMMEPSVGSVHIDTSKPAVDPNAAGGLELMENAGSAPGVNLSMDGSGRKNKSDEPISSMLYQPGPEAPAAAAAAGAPLGSASGSSTSLAQQLKDGGKGAGGWSEKAQRGFSAPRLAGSLSGSGSVSGGSSASSGATSFGSNNASISLGAARGLRDDGSADKPVAGMQALRNAAGAASLAAASKSNDAARAGLSGVFDGSKGKSTGMSAGGTALGGAYAALDAAPANLKMNDPKLDKKELKAPPARDVPEAESDNQMAKQLMMMAATAAIGGMLPGASGQMVMMMGTMMMQQQQAQDSEKRAMARQQQAAGQHP